MHTHTHTHTPYTHKIKPTQITKGCAHIKIAAKKVLEFGIRIKHACKNSALKASRV